MESYIQGVILGLLQGAIITRINSPILPPAPVRQEVVNAIGLSAGKSRGPASRGPLLHWGGGGLSES